MINVAGRYNIIPPSEVVIVFMSGLSAYAHVSPVPRAAWIVLDSPVRIPIAAALLGSVIKPSVQWTSYAFQNRDDNRLIVFSVQLILNVASVLYP